MNRKVKGTNREVDASKKGDLYMNDRRYSKDYSHYSMINAIVLVLTILSIICFLIFYHFENQIAEAFCFSATISFGLVLVLLNPIGEE